MDTTEILSKYRTVAVVGLSPNPDRPSHRVAAYLKGAGYRVVPIHPAADSVLGEKAYPTLSAVPFPVEVVDVFRKPEDVPPIAGEAVAVGAKVLWLQEGIVSAEAEAICGQAGVGFVQDRCMLKEHRKAVPR